MSAPEAATARKKLRPMRPKPLMPTRTVTALLLEVSLTCPGISDPTLSGAPDPSAAPEVTGG
ncbi:hypothetical protein GCM10027265_15170 [Jatrophihabitans fulvus]